MRFAVIGDPVAHSKSPAMHTAAYRALGLDHTYEAIRAPAADLPRLVEALRRGDYGGLNVTVPHKQRILDCLGRDGHGDVLDPSAQAVGATNTLVPRKGTWSVACHNTDVPALAIELRRLAAKRTPEEWVASSAIVIGSGGAARAAIAALAQLGVLDIAVRARDPHALKDVRGVTLESLIPTARDRLALTVVQATSAGMAGADRGDSVAAAIAWNELPTAAIALDVVYDPPETPFLAAAKSRGLRRANGLGMLVEQGALAFELWLGVPAPRDVMLAAIR